MISGFLRSAVLWMFLPVGAGLAGPPDILTSLEAALPPTGSPALLVFFSVGCPSCFDDLLEMAMFVDRERLPVRVIGISSDSASDLEEFAAKYSLKGPVVRDGRGRLRRRFKADIVPYKIVLAEDRVFYRDDSRLQPGERLRRIKKCLLELDKK